MISVSRPRLSTRAMPAAALDVRLSLCCRRGGARTQLDLV